MPFFSIAPGCILVEAANVAAFPATGAANTIYIALDTNTLYRWTGSAYAVVSASPEEVIEAANLAAFPATGEAGKLYVAIDTGLAYRWTGSGYVEISAAPVTSVAGKTGAVTLAKGDVGLGNVDNTSDANKPISTATQTALDGKAAASHSHAIADVTGLQSALDGKQASGSYAAASHTHPINDVTGLQAALDGKQASGAYAAASHGHDAATTSAAGFLSAADKSKLDGIASGATANATDAQLRDRSTHTGTQTAATISDFAAAVVAAAPPTTDASLLTQGTLSASRLPSTAVAAGSYGSASSVATFTVDATGRLTAAGSSSIAIAAGAVSGLAAIATSGSASDLSAGTVPTARLGSGTANATTYLRGDSTFAPAVTSVDGSTGAVTVTKAQVFEFTRSSKPDSATGTNGSYTWTPPSGAKVVEVVCIGGGGGGASGRKGAAGSLRFGGGGGAGGSAIVATIRGDLFPTTTIGVIVGAGGAGGAAVSASDTNGNNGANGSIAGITVGGSYIVRGYGGLGGNGGTAGSGTGGSANSVDQATYRGNGGGTAATSQTGGFGFAPAGAGGGGGAAGGSIDAANVVRAPGTQFVSSGQSAIFFFAPPNRAGGLASTTGNATAGDAGPDYGYGGSGGGAATNDVGNSGAGGNGGNGYVRITVWF